MNLDMKKCSCGEHVPINCVRCRECGAFLHSDTRDFHEQNFADHDIAEWRVAYNGQEFGPFSTNALREAFATNFVPPEAMVWKPGLADWISVHRVAELLDQESGSGADERDEQQDFDLLESPTSVTQGSDKDFVSSDQTAILERPTDIPVQDIDDLDEIDAV